MAHRIAHVLVLACAVADVTAHGESPKEDQKVSSSRLTCDDFDPQKSCAWTLRWSCPGQPEGKKGKAEVDDTLGYRCCCKGGLWRHAFDEDSENEDDKHHEESHEKSTKPDHERTATTTVMLHVPIESNSTSGDNETENVTAKDSRRSSTSGDTGARLFKTAKEPPPPPPPEHSPHRHHVDSRGDEHGSKEHHPAKEEEDQQEQSQKKSLKGAKSAVARNPDRHGQPQATSTTAAVPTTSEGVARNPDTDRHGQPQASSSTAAAVPTTSEEAMQRPSPMPIIIDTDIGDDFDDSWALALALSDPKRWDVRMVLTATKDTYTRAKIVAKYLTRFGRTDVPIGIGKATPGDAGKLAAWAEDVDVLAYNKSSGGRIVSDGIQGAAELIAASSMPVSIIGLAPMTNLAALAKSHPEIMGKVRGVYAMLGAVDTCYESVPIKTPGSCPEYNAAKDSTAAQLTFAAPWPMTISPLDTSAITIKGEPWVRLQQAAASKQIFAATVLETLRMWSGGGYAQGCMESDTLYDVVALYMSSSLAPFSMQNLSLQVTAGGATVRAVPGKFVNAGLGWIEGGLDNFLEEVADSIISASLPADLNAPESKALVIPGAAAAHTDKHDELLIGAPHGFSWMLLLGFLACGGFSLAFKRGGFRCERRGSAEKGALLMAEGEHTPRPSHGWTALNVVSRSNHFECDA
eukprot:CAMPEP_0115390124 /NCGR_PEP_ID=MMETSP0271-20121206/10041_1 /TAXON_ID=71861 /ORGANISM="Scrippsiella trochoidea, Strain CCMP3099" /LENGTH=688 /DNA_ID=CAMNT_0002813659 /DNA_START=28 /DNA_END=2094 /DNA_ORIENTATION=-